MGNPENTEKEIKTEKALRSDNKKKPVNDNRQFSRSPEKLTEYIRIGSPGGIIFIIALALVAAALITWGLAGKIPVTASLQGVVDGDTNDARYITSFVEISSNITGISEGSDVNIVTKDGRQFKGKTLPLSRTPMSSDELRKMYGGTHHSPNIHNGFIPNGCWIPCLKMTDIITYLWWKLRITSKITFIRSQI